MKKRGSPFRGAVFFAKISLVKHSALGYNIIYCKFYRKITQEKVKEIWNV